MKRKKPYGFFLLLGILVLILSYLFSGVFPCEFVLENLPNIMARYQEILRNPFHNYFNSKTILCMGAASGVYLIAVLMILSKIGNTMPGKEYGTSDWANPKQVTKRLADKSGNHILSEQLQISLNTRKTGLNNNILYIGGSGTGKTMYGVTPNISQCNSSYIILDPKGGAKRSYLKRVGTA